MPISTVYWCMASNLKALRNVFLNEKIHLCVGLSVNNMCTIFMYRRGFIIIQLFRPGRKHNGLKNLLRVLHCMAKSNSYVRIRVKIMNCFNQCVGFSISVKKCWSKNYIWLYTSISLGNAQFNHGYLSRKNEPWYLFIMRLRKCINVIGDIHYGDVIMRAMASQITSLTLTFTQSFIQGQIKENIKAPRH